MNFELDKQLSKIFEKIDKLEDDKFLEYKATLSRNLEKSYLSLQEKSDAAWKEIYEDSLDFEHNKSTKSVLKSITKVDLLNTFSKYFIGQPKKLSIRLYNKPLTNSTATEEVYGYLNNKIQSLVYYKSDFLSQAKTLHKRLSQY